MYKPPIHKIEIEIEIDTDCFETRLYDNEADIQRRTASFLVLKSNENMYVTKHTSTEGAIARRHFLFSRLSYPDPRFGA